MILSKLALSFALVCLISNTFAQSFPKYIVIDELSEDIDQLISEFGDQANVYVSDGFSSDEIEQISNSLKSIQIEKLHIYTATKPGAIVFSSISVTPNNEDEWAPILKEWAGVVSTQVVIHSEVVFTGEEGIQLKQKLENITGLVFTSHN